MSKEVINGLSVFAGMFASITICSLVYLYFDTNDTASEYTGVSALAASFALAAHAKLTKKYSVSTAVTEKSDS